MRGWLGKVWVGRQRIGSLLSQSEFAKLLHYERMRADRNLSTFSVVSFHETANPTVKSLFQLARVLTERVRATDVCGIDSRGRAAVLLPDTSEDGARTVATDIKALWKATSALHADVYVYSSGERSCVCRTGHSAARNGRRGKSASASSEALLFTLSLPAWKRVLDVGGAVIGLAILSPVMLMTALLIWITAGRPILFRQMRTGIGGRPFGIYKFRTMCRNAESMQVLLRPISEQDGPAFKLAKDPRVTRLGAWLRASSIDELPQLWNVLIGDMSLVGPRPLPCAESDSCTSWQRRRLDVTPGLTCLWQVSGRSNIRFDEWMRMDMRYIVSCSLATDLRLLLRTVPAVLLRRGAH